MTAVVPRTQHTSTGGQNKFSRVTAPETPNLTHLPVAPGLSASNVCHRYGVAVALDSVSVQIAPGTLLALVGESGSGKTSLLRCFNRMIEPDSGTVEIDGRNVRTVDAVALRRRTGYVPQSGGLLPHWTVMRNVGLVPRLTDHPDPDLSAREALERCGLPAARFGTRFPHELSGGQRQRVALARALAASQQVLLLDESFSALDAISRHELHDAFTELRTAVGFTGILVTHDIAEAARLADSIAVMRAGRIEQHGSLATLLAAPASPYVAQLLTRAQSSARMLVAP